jgi:phosphatidylserine/phosphatidylglycerophosphate/cardiolipin synthase-like enzyme
MAQDMSVAVSTVKKIDVARGFGFRGLFWQLFFTSPQPDENQRNDYGIDARFADAIGRCQRSLDIAVFELNNRIVTDAIIEAKTRGVSVRVITDDMNLRKQGYTFMELEENGIPIRTDEDSSRLMHNKFAILDQKVVWTGSWNYTDVATYKTNENVIVLESPEIAAVYAAKFKHMFEEGQFARSRHPAPSTEPPASGPTRKELPYGVRVYFAPEDNILDVLQSALGNAKSSIRFMAFVFTLNELANILIDKARTGVEVRGILEKQMANRNRSPGSVSSVLLTNSTGNLEVRLDGNPRFLHHDCFIIDDKLVITGSLNFSRQGLTYNNENL